MRKVPVVALVLLSPAQPARGQEAVPRAPRSQLERELKALDRRWAEAVVHGDAAALENLLADDYVLTDPSGDTTKKARQIADAASRASGLTIRSLRTSDVRVSADGERAVMTGRASLRATFDGEEVRQSYRYTRTFPRRQGRWQIVADRLTSLPEEDN